MFLFIWAFPGLHDLNIINKTPLLWPNSFQMDSLLFCIPGNRSHSCERHMKHKMSIFWQLVKSICRIVVFTYIWPEWEVRCSTIQVIYLQNFHVSSYQQGFSQLSSSSTAHPRNIIRLSNYDLWICWPKKKDKLLEQSASLPKPVYKKITKKEVF